MEERAGKVAKDVDSLGDQFVEVEGGAGGGDEGENGGNETGPREARKSINCPAVIPCNKQATSKKNKKGVADKTYWSKHTHKHTCTCTSYRSEQSHAVVGEIFVLRNIRV